MFLAPILVPLYVVSWFTDRGMWETFLEEKDHVKSTELSGIFQVNVISGGMFIEEFDRPDREQKADLFLSLSKVASIHQLACSLLFR